MARQSPLKEFVVVPGDRLATDARLDAQLRVGRDAGANEVVVLRLSGPLANHAYSVVVPFQLATHPGFRGKGLFSALAEASYAESREKGYGYVTGVGKLKGRLIILLDISKLLHRPEFKKLEEAAETVASVR